MKLSLFSSRVHPAWLAAGILTILAALPAAWAQNPGADLRTAATATRTQADIVIRTADTWARRANSAMSRALAAGHAADLVVHANQASVSPEGSAAYLAAVDELPGVAETSRVGGVYLAEVNEDGTLETRLLFNSALGKLLDQTAVDSLGTLRVLEGRLPESGRADEIAISPETVAATGWKVGDEITSLRLFRIEDLTEELEADPSKGTPLELTVVGVSLSPEQMLTNEENRQPHFYQIPSI